MSIKLNINIKTVGQKCEALKGLKSGPSNKDVAIKYGVPKNTVSSWAIANKYYSQADGVAMCSPSLQP